MLICVTELREGTFQIAARTLLTAKPSKGGDAEPQRSRTSWRSGWPVQS